VPPGWTRWGRGRPTMNEQRGVRPAALSVACGTGLSTTGPAQRADMARASNYRPVYAFNPLLLGPASLPTLSTNSPRLAGNEPRIAAGAAVVLVAVLGSFLDRVSVRGARPLSVGTLGRDGRDAPTDSLDGCHLAGGCSAEGNSDPPVVGDSSQWCGAPGASFAPGVVRRFADLGVSGA
jgi:hypothetical protein